MLVSLTLKIVVFAIVAGSELLVTALGVRYARDGNLPVAIGIATSALVTIAIVGWVLFVHLA